MFVTLLIAGEDKGQMRPGLAAAVAAGDEILVIERRKAVVAVPEETAPVTAEKAPEAAAGQAVVETVSYTPEAAPAQPVRKVTPQPVFTLSDVPTVAVDPAPEAEEVAEAPTSASGETWYVTANTVNVREGPSTDTAVLEKLTQGEAVAVVFEEGSEWARITIEGDGLEGYVALRFLSPEAP
jgi:uncharacterized protein YgiM (DUF1202 family)